MLALTIDLYDSFFIGDDVRVTLAATGGKRVKLLIQAPEHIPVHRQKVLRRVLGDAAFSQLLLTLKERLRPEGGSGRPSAAASTARADRTGQIGDVTQVRGGYRVLSSRVSRFSLIS